MRFLVCTLLTLSFLIAGCNDRRGDSSTPSDPVVNSATTPDDFLKFVNHSLYPADVESPAPDVNSPEYAETYYATVDPQVQRTTLSAWKDVNGFDQSDVVHATFRDTKDLGYGRDMYGWKRDYTDPGGNTCTITAIYVDNYIVQLEPGDATTYGPLNLDAAINQERKYLFGTNAIEFGPETPDDCTTPKIAKFFTFASGGDRIIKADLDGRGVKYMPSMCIVCHGGSGYPLKYDGKFDPITLKSPKMHILEQKTFQFSLLAGFTEDDQQGNIQAMNQLVYQTYLEMSEREDSYTDQANWDSSFAIELVTGAHGGVVDNNGTPGLASSYREFIPTGWRQTADRPDGVETLYRQAVEPHCIGCHSLLGTKVAGSRNLIDFSSYEDFMAYNGLSVDYLSDYVYKRGIMPLSLINNDQFWQDPDGKPALLASYLDGFDVLDDAGKVVRPGKPVAKPGADRTVASPAKLDAQASLFTTEYSWQIISSTDPAAALDDPAAEAPELTAEDGAIVVVELITSNGTQSSDPAEVTITIDNSLAVPTFTVDVKPILAGCAGGGCHNSTDGTVGIPVYFDETEADDLYRRVRARVDLLDPENSLLLRKPTNGALHGGGPVLATDSAPYNTILNWIRAGAPEM